MDELKERFEAEIKKQLSELSLDKFNVSGKEIKKIEVENVNLQDLYFTTNPTHIGFKAVVKATTEDGNSDSYWFSGSAIKENYHVVELTGFPYSLTK